MARYHYHSFYSNDTFLKCGEIPTEEYLQNRWEGIRQVGLSPVGEKWVPGQGLTLVFEGPELDADTQNLLCIKKIVE